MTLDQLGVSFTLTPHLAPRCEKIMLLLTYLNVFVFFTKILHAIRVIPLKDWVYFDWIKDWMLLQEIGSCNQQTTVLGKK